jgi:phosphoribosylformylglycinamidine synthase PurS subunit
MPRVAIDVLLKREILDPQGRAVERALPALGYGRAHDVRVGKHIELDLDVDEDDLEDTIASMADDFLTNPVIETWTWRTIAEDERADAGS